MLHTVLALVALAACGDPAPPTPTTADVAVPAPSAPTAMAIVDVAALSFPVGWLTRRIGGDAVQVEVVIPAGEDPPTWQPPGELVASLADRDLIVANGAGFEAWTATATLPEGKLVKTADALDLIELQGVTHSHGDEGEHSHTGADPHTWSDPLSFLAQAKAIHGAIVARADEAGRAEADAGLDALQRDLTGLHEQLAAVLAPAKGRALAANHPAFNYIARRYELDLTSFDLDPEEVPDAEAVAAVSAWADGAGEAPILLWEASPTAAVLAALPTNLQHVTIDPLEQPAADGYDYLGQANRNVAVFRRLFPAEAPTTP